MATSRSRSLTPAPGFRPTICRASLTNSFRCRARRAEPVWDSQSRNRLSKRMGERSAFSPNPIAARPSLLRCASLNRAEGFMKKRVLIIEDEPNIRAMMRLTLEAADYEVGEGADGEQGLEVYDEGSNWDLVLLDQRMPGI